MGAGSDPSPGNKRLTGAQRKILLALGLVSYFLVAIFLMERTGIGCVFQHFLHIPCPGCGMTRALRAVLRLDLRGAWGYNPMIFAMPYLIWFIFFEPKGRAHTYILRGLALLTLIHWGISVYYAVI